jgi:hypothetical protein
MCTHATKVINNAYLLFGKHMIVVMVVQQATSTSCSQHTAQNFYPYATMWHSNRTLFMVTKSIERTCQQCMQQAEDAATATMSQQQLTQQHVAAAQTGKIWCYHDTSHQQGQKRKKEQGETALSCLTSYCCTMTTSTDAWCVTYITSCPTLHTCSTAAITREDICR